MSFSFRRLGLIHTLMLLGIGVVTFCGNSQFYSAAPFSWSLASAQKAVEWDRYTIRGSEFSVLLPTAPAMTTFEVRPNPLDKVRTRHLVAAYFNGVVYVTYVFERLGPLDEFIAAQAPALTGYTRDLRIGEFYGKEYVSQTSELKRVDQYFISKRYVYLFQAHASSLGDADSGIARFFDSIKFESSDDHIAIVDGPGITKSTNELDSAPVVNGKELTVRAKIISKPEPSYTEEARQKQISGKVVIKGVLSASGAVTDIEFVSALPAGLSEKALAAVKQIRFIPAIKDGHFVSTRIQIENNFALF